MMNEDPGYMDNLIDGADQNQNDTNGKIRKLLDTGDAHCTFHQHLSVRGKS